MKTSHAVLIVGLVIAGLAGYGFLEADAGKPATTASDTSRLEEKVRALQDELSQLRGQVAANRDTAQQALASSMQNDRAIDQVKKAQPAVVAAATKLVAAKPASAGAAAAFTGDGQAPEVAAALATPTAVDTTSPAFQGAIRESLDSIRKQEQEERRVERDQRRQERLTVRLDEMAKRLGLLPAQRNRIAEIYTETQAQRSALFERMRAGDMPRNEIRQEMRTLRDGQNEQITGLLDPVQQAEYTKMQEEEQQDRGGRRSGRRGARRAQPSAP